MDSLDSRSKDGGGTVQSETTQKGTNQSSSHSGLNYHKRRFTHPRQVILWLLGWRFAGMVLWYHRKLGPARYFSEKRAWEKTFSVLTEGVEAWGRLQLSPWLQKYYDRAESFKEHLIDDKDQSSRT